jgi:3-deoxy-8-phosphooctulonate synthase
MAYSGSSEPMTLVAGPCVIEDEGLLMEVAQELKRQLSSLPVVLYFKASFDKANRTSIEGFRGPGMVEGLKMMDRVRDKTELRLCTDFHTPDQAKPVAEVIDFMQVPAFLCRQTDMIVAGAEAALARGRRLNVKKGQFLAPWDAKNIVQKVREVETRSGAKVDKNWFWLTERGVSFGYNTLVVDMIGFLTDGRFFWHEGEGWTRFFHVKDGYGLKILMKAGIQVAVISGGDSKDVRVRMEFLKIPHVFLATRASSRRLTRSVLRPNSIMSRWHSWAMSFLTFP